MAQADGVVLIDTEINADGMEAGSKEVEAAVRKMASTIEGLSEKAKTALNKQVDSFVKLNNEFSAQAKKVDELKRKVAEYGDQKIPTDEYKEIQNQINQAQMKMDKLIAAQEKFVAMGGKESSTQYKKYQYDIDELANTIRYAEGELKDLEESGKAFTLGSQTKQAAADMEKLAAAERKLSDINNRLGTSYSSIKGQMNSYKNNLLKVDDSQKKASASGKKLTKSLKDTGKAANSANFGLGKMLGTSILFSAVFQAISAVTNGIKEGFTNLAQYSGSTNNSISMLWSSLERLKNSLATAFAPILDVVAPILSRFIDMLSTAASYVSMFFSYLSGKGTYTKAIAVQKNYAASLQDTASGAADAAKETEAAAEAAEDYLSPLDDLNKYTDTSKSASPVAGSGGSGNNGAASGPMFEEVPIDNKFVSLLDTVIDKLKQIKDIFMSGFWDGLGDYKTILKELKTDFSSIGSYLTDIFTDEAVQASAKQFVDSFIYNVGKISGSTIKIGLTIAQNIVGGIESYLSENTDRIKAYLVSMFNIGSEVWGTFGNLAETIADIFSDVFGSQIAQNLTGNIIGIFSEIFMGVSELASALGRDLINLIAQPIIENKEKITTALQETLAPIQTITEAIETFIQNVFDKIMTLYTEHIKPFIDSVTEGISTIVGALLDGYNTYIAPVLDALAAKFSEVLNGPVGDAINSFLGFVGKVVDAIKLLWESILVPFITWIAENIMPVVAPIIEMLGNVALDLFGTIGSVVSGIFDALGGLIDFIVGVFTGDWDKAWNGIKEIFSGIWNAISSLFMGIWNILKSVVSGAVNIIVNVISTAWNGIKSLTSTVWNAIKSILSGIWNGLKSGVSAAFNAIKNVISSVWNGIKSITSSIWNGIKNVISSVINGIIGGINGMIRGVVGGLNAVIRALNKIHFSIPSWVPLLGGKSFGFNLRTITAPQIPYLASGAVIPPNREFLAVLGDQTNGNNIEAPEGLIRRIVREETQGNNNGSYTFIAQLDGKVLFRETISAAKLMQMQTGRNPYELA